MEPPSLSLACHSSSLFLDQGKIESKWRQKLVPNFAHPESFAYLPDIRFLLLSMSAVLYYLVFILSKSNTSAPLRTLLLMSAVARIEGTCITCLLDNHIPKGETIGSRIPSKWFRTSPKEIQTSRRRPLRTWVEIVRVSTPSILLIAIAISSQVRYSWL